MLARQSSSTLEREGCVQHVVDWNAVEASVADSRTLEQAVGRAVVIADQMSRGAFHGYQPGDSPLSRVDDPFFAFSMADVVPDFGDERRYRTKMARKITNILGAGGRR